MNVGWSEKEKEHENENENEHRKLLYQRISCV